LLCRFQKRAEIFEFCDQSVLDGDHAVGALTLALEVRPVTSRTLVLGSEIGVATTSVTAWYPCDDLPGKGLWCNSPRSTATRVLPSLLRERGRR
jgi:hypothetical protein